MKAYLKGLALMLLLLALAFLLSSWARFVEGSDWSYSVKTVAVFGPIVLFGAWVLAWAYR